MKVDEVEQVFLCRLSICTASFMKHTFKSFALVGCLVSFLLICWSSLYMQCTQIICWIYALKIPFSHSVDGLLTILMVSFDKQKFLILIRSNLSYLILYD